ncbi:hypothetical protein GBZ48_17790 [Azospirillum melinis]|uniref:Uncharacterized protein n=1 Tax=Azospirillum melinis TaxID=328839 RepID=A0ABX2KD75_9PROT|nr:hypothetical protein [Azospirillum melinis]MBP2304605.1 hypothetical protein [Azospirillum melinis]NUB01129.1 hypothetical protein [Azospirillum melinis]
MFLTILIEIYVFLPLCKRSTWYDCDWTVSMIPAFASNGVLPPYVMGNPTNPDNMSPYQADILTFCRRFCTSPKRLEILKGFLRYRKSLHDIGIPGGFQWIDGSFSEDIESIEGRNPNDVDVVTFFDRPHNCDTSAKWRDFFDSHIMFFDPSTSKEAFLCDAYPVDLGMAPLKLVSTTRYWFGLFSHRRVSNIWKGMVQLPLGNAGYDQAASDYLDQVVFP